MERYLAQLDIVGRALILLQNNVLPMRGLALSEEWLGVRVARKWREQEERREWELRFLCKMRKDSF